MRILLDQNSKAASDLTNVQSDEGLTLPWVCFDNVLHIVRPGLENE